MGEQALFSGGGAFHAELRRRVKAELTPRRVRLGRVGAVAKGLLMAAWVVASYLALLLWADNVWQVVLLAVSLGSAVAGLAFCVGHDANHGALFTSRRVNRIVGSVFDLIGASSYVWRAKHNHAHHSYTNVAGADSDIEQMPFARLAPDQPLHWYHRWQFIYMWGAYGFYTLKHHTMGDMQQIAGRRAGGLTPLPRPKGSELAVFVIGKVVFWTWALVIPLLLRPALGVLLAFLIASMVLGATLAVVFQMAHCVDEAEFSSVERLRAADTPVNWAEHQVETTVDFCTSNRLMTFYLGGLNFQVEHHLFPKVCHVHYPRLVRIVRETCEEFGVPYKCHPTLRAAMASHGRWLHRMGRPDPVTTGAASVA